jgi:pre-mRNA-splicing factor CDC5/CEF1
MVDASKVESQDNASGSLLVDAGNQEDGKNSIPLVGASEGNAALSSDGAVTNEQNDMVPE